MRIAFNAVLNDYKTNRPNELIPVYSAFNGFAIYKTRLFANCSYSSNIRVDLFPINSIQMQMTMTNSCVVNNVTNDCEHRAFHLEAIQKNGARIRITTKSLFAKFANPPPNLRGPA